MGNEIKSGLWFSFIGVNGWLLLSAFGVTHGITTLLLGVVHDAPIFPIAAAAAVIAGRAALARDVSLTDAAAALAPVALALYLSTIHLPNREIGLDQWEIMCLIGGLWAALGIAFAWPSMSPNWKELDNGLRIRSKPTKQNGVYVEHQEDSRTRHKVWNRRNTALKVIILLCACFVSLSARLINFAWLVSWAAVVVQGYCLVLFGWGQIIRLDFVAYHPVAPKPAADPTPQQPQGDAPRRRTLS